MTRIVLILVVGATLMLSFGCGSDDVTKDASEGTKTEAAAAVPTTATVASPEDLGQTIYKDFVALHKELTAMLAGSPAAADLKPKVADLKNRYIERFVGYGRLRAKMTDADAAKVESETRRLLFASPTVNVDALSQAVQRFNPTDPALARELTSLNIITQYAFFELLKKQDPDEARRLGIN